MSEDFVAIDPTSLRFKAYCPVEKVWLHDDVWRKLNKQRCAARRKIRPVRNLGIEDASGAECWEYDICECLVSGVLFRLNYGIDGPVRKYRSYVEECMSDDEFPFEVVSNAMEDEEFFKTNK
jgi:hypothetical protein